MKKYKKVVISEKEATPYKILLGTVFRQLIEDALPHKKYNALWKARRKDPNKFTSEKRSEIDIQSHIARQARYFIFSKMLDEMISGAKAIDPSFELDAGYFREHYLKIEKLHNAGKLEKANPVCYNI